MDKATRTFWIWLPIAVAVTLLCGISYALVQQVYRQDANDPQIQMAEDAARVIGNGGQPAAIVGSNIVDPSVSLAPFLIVTDASGTVVASGMKIGAESPAPPKGALDAAKTSGQNRVTWQPRVDARIASVIVPIGDGTTGFVTAGRSLRAVEERVDGLMPMIVVGWLATLIASFAAMWIAIGATTARPKKAVPLD